MSRSRVRARHGGWGMYDFDPWDDIPLQYVSAADAAACYVRLREAGPGSVTGLDPERMLMRQFSAAPQGAECARQIAALDAQRDLERVFRAAILSMALRYDELRAATRWRLWWTVRIEGVTLEEADAELGRARVHQLVREVDGEVLTQLGERDMRRTLSDELEAYLSTPAPRVRVHREGP